MISITEIELSLKSGKKLLHCGLRRLNFGYLQTILHVNKKRILVSSVSSLLILINATSFPAETFNMFSAFTSL